MKLSRKVTVLTQDLLQFKDRHRERLEKRNLERTGGFLLLVADGFSRMEGIV